MAKSNKAIAQKYKRCMRGKRGKGAGWACAAGLGAIPYGGSRRLVRAAKMQQSQQVCARAMHAAYAECRERGASPRECSAQAERAYKRCRYQRTAAGLGRSRR